MDAPVSRNFLKIQFLKLISVMTHFVLEKIDWDFQFSEWIRRFWAFSKKFWAFLKKSIFENFYKCFDPFCMGKNWFWDFQFSGWIRRFWAIFEKFHFWKFLHVFWPILYRKKKKILKFRFLILWMNHWKIKKISLENFTMRKTFSS